MKVGPHSARCRPRSVPSGQRWPNERSCQQKDELGPDSQCWKPLVLSSVSFGSVSVSVADSERRCLHCWGVEQAWGQRQALSMLPATLSVALSSHPRPQRLSPFRIPFQLLSPQLPTAAALHTRTPHFCAPADSCCKAVHGCTGSCAGGTTCRSCTVSTPYRVGGVRLGVPIGPWQTRLTLQAFFGDGLRARAFCVVRVRVGPHRAVQCSVFSELPITLH